MASMRPPILILVGTQTGNAEKVAESVADELTAAGLGTEVVDMWDAYPEVVAAHETALLCISTWGDGDLPDNAVDLFEALERVGLRLDHLRYGIIALGDHAYDPHFCSAGHRFDALLASLGARKLADVLEIDEGPTEADLDGVRGWVRDTVLEKSGIG